MVEHSKLYMLWKAVIDLVTLLEATPEPLVVALFESIHEKYRKTNNEISAYLDQDMVLNS